MTFTYSPGLKYAGSFNFGAGTDTPGGGIAGGSEKPGTSGAFLCRCEEYRLELPFCAGSDFSDTGDGED